MKPQATPRGSNHLPDSGNVLDDLKQVSRRLAESVAAVRAVGNEVSELMIEELTGLIVHARKLSKTADAERLHKKYNEQQVVDAVNGAYNPVIKMAKENSKQAESLKLAYDARIAERQRAEALAAAAKLAESSPELDKADIETAALAAVEENKTAQTEHGSLQTQTRRRVKITNLRAFVESQLDKEWLSAAANTEAARMVRAGESSPFVEMETYQITIAR